MRKLNKNKGITLIVLIITIIVMLILVGVTISMAVNGKLFEYAGKAVGDTQNAIDKEKELANGRIKIGDKWYDSIDDYLNKKPSANQDSNGGENDGGLKITSQIRKDGRNVYIDLTFSVDGVETANEYMFNYIENNFYTDKEEAELEEMIENITKGTSDEITFTDELRTEMKTYAESEGLSYKAFLKFLLLQIEEDAQQMQQIQDPMKISVTVSDGDTFESGLYETHSYWVYEDGIYTFNAVNGEGKKATHTVEVTGTTPEVYVGDYVNYTPNSGTYTVASGANGSGYTSNQTFTTDSSLKWRVWSIDEEAGTVELVADKATHQLYLQGADGYNHAVDILNDMCKALYSNTNGAIARSINVDDINAKTTYDYTTYSGSTYTYGKQIRLSTYGTGYMNYPNLYSQEKGYGTANAFLQNLGESTGLKDGVTNENGVTTYSTVTGYTNGNTAGTDPYVTYTYYSYTPESKLKSDQGVNTVPTGLINLGETYWLASRCARECYGYADFFVRVMNSDGGMNGGSLFDSDDSAYGRSYACRPVVTLSSNVSLALDKTNTTESVTYWNIEY